MGASEISQFLTWLAVDRQISASTQNQALSALLFLYRAVLTIEIGAVPSVVRTRTPERSPVVLSREEIGAILKQLTGTERVVVMLLYGAGLRLEECLELRVKDVDFDRHQIIVRQGKGRKDRMTMLPSAAREALSGHLADVRRIHEADLARGFGRLVLPFALGRKFPKAATECRWQFMFPAGRICRAPRFGPPSRYHLHESVVQKAVAQAARPAGITKRVCEMLKRRRRSARNVASPSHTPAALRRRACRRLPRGRTRPCRSFFTPIGAHLFRHSLATHMLTQGASLPEIGDVLRHRRPDTTAISAKVDLVSLRSIASRGPEVPNDTTARRR